MDAQKKPGETSSIADLLSDYSAGRRTVSGSVAESLALAKRCQVDVRAFAEIDEDGALDAASRSDHRYREGTAGLLEGVPVAVKDMIDTGDMPTRYGSPAYEGHQPDSDAFVVQVLRENGAVVVGKTTTHEFAWGVTTSSEALGDTLNPYDHTKIPGGSSGGMAAAIACGAVRGGLGTDTGGSVRIPAALCGVVGFKPTFGFLSTNGVFPLAFSLDHVGILARSVEDVRLISGAFGIARQANAGRSRFRIGVIRDLGGVPMSAEVADLFTLACGRLKQSFDLTEWPDENLFIGAFETFAGIVLVEGGVTHFGRNDVEFIQSRYGRETASRLKLAETVSLGEYAKWQQRRRELARDLDSVMRTLDFLVLPTCPCTAPLIGEDRIEIGSWSGTVRQALMTYTAPFNLAGLPAISIPIGHAATDGMPVGLQVVAARGCDAQLLEFAADIDPGARKLADLEHRK
ncbi:amidase [Pararhizobium sp.]|uniref:amidase n=1 Tax=Pararhizobium sp. TaxID=1977563 RepID=UPI003D11B431